MDVWGWWLGSVCISYGILTDEIRCCVPSRMYMFSIHNKLLVNLFYKMNIYDTEHLP